MRDTASGFTLDRPGLAHVRQLARDGRVDVVLAFALDRLSRKQTHVAILVEEVEQAGVRLEFVTEAFEQTATGQLLRSVKAFVAELEREKIAERTMRGKAERARSGRLPQGTGRGCYGYLYSAATGTRTIHPGQAAVVRRIFQQFCAGASVHGIAMTLNSEGLPTFAGNPWHPLTIRRILQNETYTGTSIYRRTVMSTTRSPRTGKTRRRATVRPESEWIAIPDASPAIITPELWERAQHLLADPPQRGRRGQAIYPYLLTGHIRCDCCRTPLAGSALSGGSGRHRIRYYGCRNRTLAHRGARCGSRYVRAEQLEARLVTALRRVLADPAQIVFAYQQLRAEETSAQRYEHDLAEAWARVTDAEKQLDRLARLARFAEDDDVLEALGQQMRQVGREKKIAEGEVARLAQAQPAMPHLEMDEAFLTDLSERVAAWLDPTDQEKMRLALEGLEVTVFAGAGEPYAEGSLPLTATCERHGHADVRSMVINSPTLREYHFAG